MEKGKEKAKKDGTLGLSPVRTPWSMGKDNDVQEEEVEEIIKRGQDIGTRESDRLKEIY